MTTRISAHLLAISTFAIVSALLLAALLAGGWQRALAHAGYEESTLADGETVSESPIAYVGDNDGTPTATAARSRGE